MNKTLSKITSVEAVCLILIIVINRIILNLPQDILNICASSSIINTIYISIIAIIFIYVINKLYKNFTTSDIIDISEFLGGKFLRNTIGIILIIYLLFVSGILLRNFTEIVHIIYYSRDSIIYLLLFFLIVGVISNYLGESAIIKANVTITVIMIISLLIVFISVIPNMTLQRIFPILGYGSYETFFFGLSNVFSFNGLLCIYVIMPLLSEKKDFPKVTISATILLSILIILSVASLVLSFAFRSGIESISPIYTLIENNEFGDFLKHPESLFIFSWFLSMLTYLNVIIMFLVRFLKKITSTKNSRFFIIPVCILIFVISLIPQNIIETYKFERLIYFYLATPLAFAVFPLILICANIKTKKKNKKNNNIIIKEGS